MSRPRYWLPEMLLLVLSLSQAAPAAPASGPGALIVRIFGAATKTSLHLQPGYATVIRADRRIDTVAIGDPRLVTATTVKRGQDVYDLVLQPQTTTGVTNMVVWFGDLTSIWDLVIGPGQRTADLVYVVTAPVTAARPGPAPPPSPAPGAARASGRRTGLAPAAAGTVRADAPSAWLASAPLFLEAQQVIGNAEGTFQVFRGRDQIRIRYRITNSGTTDYSVRLPGLLVRVNGRPAPFGVTRDPAVKDRPAVLPGGMTETGVITAPARAPRQVEIIFALFPAGDRAPGPSRTVPVTFQAMFTGLDDLATSTAH